MLKEEILHMMEKQEDFLSGQEMCNVLGVSRTAVWKAIRQLEAEGYEIEAVRNKGYRLLSEPDLLTEKEISENLHTRWAGRHLVLMESTDSTNNEAKRLAEAGEPCGTLVISEIQTAGRGRMGRPWSSPKKSGIWMSLLIRPKISPVHASMITLVMGLSVQQAVKNETGLSCWIKWPNDIVADGKKICGILTEMSAETDAVNHIVIGVGINVLNEAFPDEIRSVATSILKETGASCSRNKIIAETMNRFEHNFDIFLKTEDLSGLLDTYNASLINRNRQVRVLDPAGEYSGTAAGIDKDGELLVRTEDTVRKVTSGEVSVRGVYGYV